MSEPNQILKILEGFTMGEAITGHNGVVCYPAMRHNSDDKYIVKKISVPASQVQLAALLLTGAYATHEEALTYYKELAEEITQEMRVLNALSNLEGFIPYLASEISQKEDASGYEVTLISPYQQSLEQIFTQQVMTHQGIMDLAMDLCAALAACRRSGYLYIDLKPGNVFYTQHMDYRIGDLGFVSLSSLKYASLPDKYRSVYTAPEIVDAASELNTTMDVYSLGMVLYQAYNGGILPIEDGQLVQPLLPPMYADYEMAEIIMTACHEDPAQRWENPTQFGQALVQYMQRNGVSEEPIIPAPVATPELDAGEDFLPEEDISDDEDWSSIPDLAFIQELEEGIAAEKDNFQLDGEAIEDDTAEILAQADDLIAHVLPAPVKAPEPIDVPMPEPIALEADTQQDTVDIAPDGISFFTSEIQAEDAESLDTSLPPNPDAETLMEEVSAEEAKEDCEETESEASSAPVIAVDADIADQVSHQQDAEESETQKESDPEPDSASEAENIPEHDFTPAPKAKTSVDETIRRKPKAWVRLVVSLVVIALLAGLALMCYHLYQQKYLKTVESLVVTGTENSIIVQVQTDADEEYLRVTCSDTYGNTVSSKVTNGSAIFTGLAPQTRYTIRVTILGNYKLEGTLTYSFTTDSVTQIDDLTATIGPADGSVYLSFRVTGVECDEWILSWSAPGIESQSLTFAGHNVTVYDLIIGKEYTFTLSPGDDSKVVGQTQVSYLARPITRAENAEITACGNGSLTVQWNPPAGETVSKWIVRCYDGSGYDQTVTTDQCSYTFQGLTHETACTVEITADGMPQGIMTTISANPITVTVFNFLPDGNGNLVFQWEYIGNAPEGGWRVSYSCDGILMNTLTATENRVLLNYVPNCTYSISLIPMNGATILGHTCSFPTPRAESFDRYGVQMVNLQFTMCATPGTENWDWSEITQDAYKTTFAEGEQAGFVIWCDAAMENAEARTAITFALYSSDGTLLDISAAEGVWNELWHQGFCELDIPTMPSAPGRYTLWVYFDGMLAASQDFTVQ